MGEVLGRLRATAGESGLRNALGRWRQRVSHLLDSSGGIVAIENQQLAFPGVVLAVNDPLQTTLVTSSIFNLDGAVRNKSAAIRVGVNARLQTGDTLASLFVRIQTSADGGAFGVIAEWLMGDFDLDTQYLSSTYEIIQPININVAAQWRVVAKALGTAGDEIVIDPAAPGASQGFAYLTVQISNDPST